MGFQGPWPFSVIMWIYARSLCSYVVQALKIDKESGANANDIFLLKQNVDIMFP